MIMWLIELIFMLVLMRFIEEIGLWGCCVVFAIINILGAIMASAGLTAILMAGIEGIVLGFFAFLAVEFFLFLIRVLGTIGTVIVGLFFVLALLAIIL